MKTDTIAAISTPLGRAALAVVRLSGPDARAIAGRMLRGLRDLPPRTLHHGWALDTNGEAIDEVMAVLLAEPASYTGEDMVEITCHGGAQSAPRILRGLIDHGARAAGPGEFTQRAFLNGRIDLAQAEAVADVIHAESDLAHRLATRQIRGALSQGLSAVAEPLRDLLAETEALVDFAEDAGLDDLPSGLEAGLARSLAALDRLLLGADLGRRAREGVRVAIVGRPNVGKSSLFNALLGEDRAIVNPLPGTTRDALSEPLVLAGVPVRLADTAGVREAEGEVERLGIARTEHEIENADLVLWVLDGSAPEAEEERAVARLLTGRPHVLALNKSDLPRVHPSVPDAVEVSARTGEGVASLREKLAWAVSGGVAGAGAGAAAEVLVTNTRHIEALDRARAALVRAREAARPLVPGGAAGREPGEILAGEIRLALEALGEVTGEAVAPDLLDRIFARFCIGK